MLSSRLHSLFTSTCETRCDSRGVPSESLPFPFSSLLFSLSFPSCQHFLLLLLVSTDCLFLLVNNSYCFLLVSTDWFRAGALLSSSSFVLISFVHQTTPFFWLRLCRALLSNCCPATAVRSPIYTFALLCTISKASESLVYPSREGHQLSHAFLQTIPGRSGLRHSQHHSRLQHNMSSLSHRSRIRHASQDVRCQQVLLFRWSQPRHYGVPCQ